MKYYYWVILAALAWGVAPLMEKMGLAKIAPVAGVFIRSMAVILGGLAIAVINPVILKDIAGYNIKSIMFIIAGGILASIFGQLFFYTALKSGEVSKVVPIAASYPLLSFILGVLFLNEGVTAAKIAGMVLIIAGIYLLK